jgi:hypothetical protein
MIRFYYWIICFSLLPVLAAGGCAFKMGGDITPAPAPSALASARLPSKPPDEGGRSALIIPYDTDKLILESASIVLGKVAEILPSRESTSTAGEGLSYDIYTDILIQAQRYFWGGPGDRVVIRVQGGKIGNLVMWAEDVPIFAKGETALFFLSLPQRVQADSSGTDDGVTAPAYYLVTGAMQGKYEYQNGSFISLSGQTLTPAELEQKIARLRHK